MEEPKNCTVKGEIYQHGERWEKDECKYCMCNDGRVDCESPPCDALDCTDPIKVDGECCMRCPGKPPYFFFPFFFCNLPDTQGLKATLRCGSQSTFLSRGCCHLLLGLKQGYPLYSPYTLAQSCQFYCFTLVTRVWVCVFLL